MKKIVFIINNVDFLISHRLPILIEAQKNGFQTHVIAPNSSNNKVFAEHKIIGHDIFLSRGGNNPILDLFTLCQIIKLLKFLKPDLVHLVTIKSIIYGGIAARIAKVPHVVAAVSGLGTVFLSRGVISGLRRLLVKSLYRCALKHQKIRVIFQNPDDRNLLVNAGILKVSDSCLIRGSGVDLREYPYLPENFFGKTVVMASRLLKDKGVYELIEAARLLKQRNVEADIKIIGSPDDCNPTSITEAEISKLASENIVEFCGFRSDIAEQYSKANIVCLPSYREGLPKCLVEAAACGRAAVTTNVPGCRDAIEANVTGMLVAVRDPVSLADTIEFLLKNPDERIRMGKAGRSLAENEYSIENIVNQHLSIYKELINS